MSHVCFGEDNLRMTYSVISQLGREQWKNGMEKSGTNYIFLGKTLMWMTEEGVHVVHTDSI